MGPVATADEETRKIMMKTEKPSQISQTPKAMSTLRPQIRQKKAKE